VVPRPGNPPSHVCISFGGRDSLAECTRDELIYPPEFEFMTEHLEPTDVATVKLATLFSQNDPSETVAGCESLQALTCDRVPRLRDFVYSPVEPTGRMRQLSVMLWGPLSPAIELCCLLQALTRRGADDEWGGSTTATERRRGTSARGTRTSGDKRRV
jgi:hypothetical protein